MPGTHSSSLKRHSFRRRGDSAGPLFRRGDPPLIDLPFPVPSIPILEPLISPLLGGRPLPTPASPSGGDSGGNNAGSTPTPTPQPALINLPIPLPSIPVLNNILTPLIAGKKPAATPAPAPTPTPAPAPAPSSPSSGGGGSGNGSSGSGSGNGSSSSGSSGSSGSGNPNSGSGSIGSGGNSAGNSGGSNGGNSGNGNDSGSGNTGSSGSSGSGSGNVSGSSGPNGTPSISGNNAGPNSAGSVGSNHFDSTGNPSGNGSGSPPSGGGTNTGGNTGNGSSSGSPSTSVSSSDNSGDGKTPSDASPSGVAGAVGGNNVSTGSLSNSTESAGGSDSGTGSNLGNSTSSATGVKNFAAGIPGSSSTESSGSSNGDEPSPAAAGGFPSAAPSELGGLGGVGSGGSGGTGSPSDPSNPTGNGGVGSGGNAKSYLSSGAIAGIVVASIIFALLALIFVMRRRFKVRRSQRRMNWFHGSGLYSPTHDSTTAEAGSPRTARISARSSFGTRFDRGLFYSPEDDDLSSPPVSAAESDATPSRPPMAQVRQLLSPVAVKVMTPTHPPAHSSTAVFEQSATLARNSVASFGSAHSSLNTDENNPSQYLSLPAPAATVHGDIMSHPRPSIDDPTTPMSVRPFSPNESFSFPKPPVLHKSPSLDPFEDPVPSGNASRHVSQEPPHVPERSSSVMSEFRNPFSDDASIERHSTTSSQLTAGALETVCRPFMPTLADELAVKPGDVVCILHAYDDGWVQVRKQSDKSRGLIPIDCFREDEEDIPAFLASKRVSSFFGTAV